MAGDHCTRSCLLSSTPDDRAGHDGADGTDGNERENIHDGYGKATAWTDAYANGAEQSLPHAAQRRIQLKVTPCPPSSGQVETWNFRMQSRRYGELVFPY